MVFWDEDDDTIVNRDVKRLKLPLKHLNVHDIVLIFSLCILLCCEWVLKFVTKTVFNN